MSSNFDKQHKILGLVRAAQNGGKGVSPHLKKKVLAILKEIRDPSLFQESKNNPVAKQFTVKDKFENYVKRYVGQPFLPKELEALNNFEGAKPTKTERSEIRFETSDEFNNNTTTVIKKMKDSGQFSFTAFTKHAKAEPKEDEPEQPEQLEPNDMDVPKPEPEGMSPMREVEGEQPTDEKDDIIVSKSTLFKDDIKGGAILAEFLKKLDL